MSTAVTGITGILLVFLLNGCDEPRQGGHETTQRAVTNSPAPVPECISSNDAARVPPPGDLAAVAAQTRRFASRLTAVEYVEELLAAATNGMATEEMISNLIARIEPGVLVDAALEMYGRYQLRYDASARAAVIMRVLDMLYQAPDAPAWVRLLALSNLGDYYCYHNEQNPEQWRQYRELMQQATLSENPSVAEKNNYITIQFDLVTRLQGYEALKQIEKVEGLVKEGLIPADIQPVQMLPLLKAIELVSLGRDEEARQCAQEVYDRLDKLDYSIRGALRHGVEHFLNRYRISYPDLYPNATYDFELDNQ